MNIADDFSHLVPDVMLDAVEDALGRRMSGLATPLPSYINRVYEVQAGDGERLIAKFYRPGRWSREAIQEEHAFALDCAAAEIPVAPPMTLPSGQTLHEANGVYFAVFRRYMGRQFELRSRTDWLRVGSLLGRLHVAGSCRDAIHRMRLQPSEATTAHIRYLLGQGIISPRYAAEFEDITGAMLDAIDNLFEEAEFIRIHGDCHGGNILKRPGEGLMLIDFDDMMVGPPIQDLWLLLPGRLPDCLFEFDLLLRGYEQFREFDATTGRLIEPLRAMRMIYFLSWCAHQRDDYTFRQNHPQWGTDAFWQRENRDLTTQLQHIRTEWAS